MQRARGLHAGSVLCSVCLGEVHADGLKGSEIHLGTELAGAWFSKAHTWMSESGTEGEDLARSVDVLVGK